MIIHFVNIRVQYAVALVEYTVESIEYGIIAWISHCTYLTWNYDNL